MSDPAVRVALLGRAGKARDQLHRALSESGASIVAEGDPAELDPSTVAGLSPTCYLVSLEPAIERSLERFDDLLAAPGVEVMFDDAETSARLDGWDLNRWARHIAAKLLGHDGLPPAPGAAHADADPAGADFAGAEFADDDAPAAAGGLASPGGFDIGSPSFDDDAGGDDLGESIALEPATASGNEGDLDLDALGLELAGMGFSLTDDGDASGTGDDLADSISFSSDPEESPDSGMELDLDVAELTAQMEAYEQSGRRAQGTDAGEVRAAPRALGGNAGIEAIDAVGVAEQSPPPPVAARPSFDFGELSLAPVDEGMAAPAPVAFEAEPSSELRLAPISGHEGLGAVVILAGLGGPDAVRQLLASLPEDLPAPVLLYQHLEVGKHERLVDQLAKVSKLPVVLAQVEGSPQGGQVTLLPAGMTAVARDERLVFVPGELSALLLSLPPRESMVVVLSGADASLVPTILEVRDAGGLVFAQDPEVCFDAGASEALQGEGATVLPALGLARRIAERWSQ